MRRVGVTLDDVTEAAETLHSRGENPTIDRVRAFLGGTGSNTTIAKYLQTWRQHVTHAVKPDQANTPPENVQIAVQRVWQQIREETDAEIETIKSDTQAIIQASEEQLTAAIKEGHAFKAMCEELQATVHALQAKNEIQQLDYQQLSTEYRVLQERSQGLEKRCSDTEITMAKQQADMTLAHHQEVKLLNEQLTGQAVIFQKLVDEVKDRAEDARSQHMRETDELKTHYQKLRNELELSTSTVTEKDRELIALKTEGEAIKRERDTLSGQLQEQQKYWSLIENNNEITKHIWAEVKDIPKIDVGLSYLTYISEVQNQINQSMQRLDKATHDASATADLLSQITNFVKQRD